MRKVILTATAFILGLAFYACNKTNTNPAPDIPVWITATLTNQGVSGATVSSSATAFFTGLVAKGYATSGFSGSNTMGSTPYANTLNYSITYVGTTPTAITLEPVSSVPASGSALINGSILLWGSLKPSITTSPGSGTVAMPGSGTVTVPSGTTTTVPGSGTTTGSSSSTATTPGSSTTTPGSTTVVGITSPYTGVLGLSQARTDSLKQGFYTITIRSADYPTGELRGTIHTR